MVSRDEHHWDVRFGQSQKLFKNDGQSPIGRSYGIEEVSRVQHDVRMLGYERIDQTLERLVYVNLSLVHPRFGVRAAIGGEADV